MDIEHLRTFCTAVELGSMAKAAAALGLSQPAVSQEIRSLEAHLGVRLLDRTPQGVVPTEYGSVAYAGYRTVLRTCSSVHDEIVRRRAQGKATLVVGASAYPGGYLVPFAIGPFGQLHPDVTVELRVRPVPDLLALLEDGSLECAFLDGPVDAPGLAAEALASDPAQVVAAAASPWASDRQKELTLAEWLELPHVLCDPRCTSLSLFAWLAGQRLDTGRFSVAATVESLEAAKALVAAGIGLGLFPSRAVRQELQAEVLRVVPVRGLRFRVPLTVVHRKGSPLTPMAQAFADQVRETLRPRRGAGRLRDL